MSLLLVVLYVASAGLTILGAVGLWRKAKRNTERMQNAIISTSPGPPTYSQVQAAVTITVEDLQSQAEDTKADLWLVCGGVGLGTLGSIISLFIAA